MRIIIVLIISLVLVSNTICQCLTEADVRLQDISGKPSSNIIYRENCSVSADSIKYFIEQGFNLKLVYCKIEGGLELSNSATFGAINHGISFFGCVFNDSIYVYGCKFEKEVLFDSCVFKSQVSIRRTGFERRAYFDGCVFQENANFSDCTFKSELTFIGTKFFKLARFDRTNISTEYYFEKGFVSAFNYCEFLGKESIYARIGNMDSLEIMDVSGSFIGTKMGDVSFFGSNIDGVVFEPDSLSKRSKISLGMSKGLSRLRYATNSLALSELRGYYKSNSYKNLAKQITCSLRRQDQNILERVLFDFTCEYGSNYSRPLILLLISIVFFTAVYYVFFRLSKKAGVLIGEYNYAKNKNLMEEKMHTNDTAFGVVNKIKYAFYLSMRNSLSFGFGGYDFNQMVLKLLNKKARIEPYGWVRTISGVQSIISLYLIALTVLSYFTYMFE